MSDRTKFNPLFRVGLDIYDRECLVIGGGNESEEKCNRLLDAGAKVLIIAQQLTPKLNKWAEDEIITHKTDPFCETDLENIMLVVNTISDNIQFMQDLYKLASRKNILVNSFDKPTYSNFGMVALVRKGYLRLSVSTSNTSPSLAARIRQDMDTIFSTEEFLDFSEMLAKLRQNIRKRVPNRKKRFALLRSLVQQFQIDGQIHYPNRWQERFSEILNCQQKNCEDQLKNCQSCPLSK
ncbi:MAG: bifunctional precorrin-2 dehydrogenase/sirohydrochlorin ferrochelatase [Candidatus Latescibacterota bacterium]|nr:bifunctional precorrin-2 dehydrogenase/sirohydrochlorin ferrochelatase [Candidatus Latescibacterota bacterium]